MTGVPLRRVTGRFYRAVRADRAEHVLDLPMPGHAGRYHRPGQSALYITPQVDWAMIAIGRYTTDDVARVIVPLELDAAFVVDQHDRATCRQLGIDPDASNVRWQDELAPGREPPSWSASDIARAAGADGIIDRSRGIVGGWHVALFRWNTDHAPQLAIIGAPFTIDYADARERWPAPPGWSLKDAS